MQSIYFSGNFFFFFECLCCLCKESISSGFFLFSDLAEVMVWAPGGSWGGKRKGKGGEKKGEGGGGGVYCFPEPMIG